MTLHAEFRLIERLKRLIPRSLQGALPIGDDTAILSMRGRATRRVGPALLFTTDAIVEGVDFRIGKGGASPEAIGHKALAVNLSDIAAMGGKPLAFVVAWGIPQRFSQRWVERVAKGILRLARQFDVAWVGGDLSRSSRFFIAIALLGEGERKRIILRKGARRGDTVYMTGRLGGSIQGKHLTFTPRIREAQFLATHFSPTAMIDISDGFIQDLGHVLVSSKVSAQIELEAIPISPAAASLARQDKRKALRSALTDGEDFELLFTLPSARGPSLEKVWRKKFPKLSLTKVGKIVAPPLGRIFWLKSGRPLKGLWFQKTGYAHF